MLRTRRLALVLLLCLTAARQLDAATLLDPLLRFRQTRTPHFVIYFHAGEEHLASRLVRLVEPVRGEVGAALGVEPPALTHVILADQTEVANGWATPLPRSTVFLNAAAPSGSDFIGRTDDWLRLVFTHEYTHIVHLELARGWGRVARGVLGRNGIAFPNMWLPQWQIEGIATFEESALTGEGRAYAGDFLSVQRTAAAGGKPLSLDRASGGLAGWPDGHAAYAAGLGFHQYLAERFGADSLGRLATATAGSLPYLGSRKFAGVFGQSLGTLWRDYGAELRGSSTATGRRRTEAIQVTREGHLASGPRFAPASCAACSAEELLYMSRTPHDLPSLRRVTGIGTSRKLTDGYLGSTVGLSGRAVVFDRQEIRRNVGLYSELALFDGRTGRVQGVRGTERLQDPDVAPDGRSVVAVRERRGARELVVVRLHDPIEAFEGELVSHVGRSTLQPPVIDAVSVLAGADDQQFSAPRWSPDGRSIAAERRRLGALPEVVVVDAATGGVSATLADPGARVVTPTWLPDGSAIVAAADFDGGPFELYEFPLTGDRRAYRLTATDGAMWPDVSRDGTMLAYAGYTTSGYQVFTMRYARLSGPARVLGAPRDLSLELTRDLPTEAYSPWPTLLPTSWTPYLVTDVDQVRAGGVVSGADVLARHAWSLSASWMLDGPDVVRPLLRTTPDWAAGYAYTRWRPTLFAAVSKDAVFRTVSSAAATGTSRVAGVEHETQAGVSLPFLHVRHSAQVLGAIAASDTSYRLATGDRMNRTVAARAAAAFNSSQRFGFSVSRERGVLAGSTAEIASRALGSRANATTATADVRAFLPGLARHHVVALRAAGGISNGSDLARQQFSLGALSASTSVIDFGSNALGLMRGGLRTAVAGNRLAVGNAEYRFPLKVVERGRGTFPLMIRIVHASFFADVAQVRGDGRSAAGWARAFGGELSVDAVAGHGLPVVATVGAAWGRDGSRPGAAQVYARLSRAF